MEVKSRITETVATLRMSATALLDVELYEYTRAL